MRVTRFDRDGNDVRAMHVEQPRWVPYEQYDGQALQDVRRDDVHQTPRLEVQLVHIAAGGHFVMHTSPDFAFCQIIRGRGVLRLPDGTEIPYVGPELYLFDPDTLHEWVDISDDTLLSVCLVRRPGAH